MLKITILAVGKIKDESFKKSFEKYLKMVAPYAVVRIDEITSEPFFNNSDKERIKQKEGEKIINHLKKNNQSNIFILDERGREFESSDFSKILFKNETIDSIFIIGGTLGLSKEVLIYKNSIKLSLSKMTFPHEMVRVILAEQIYRAIAINKNKSYHY
jgi:23S rRNA (pseudouridine1915-N3)-methyltransferase